MRIFVRFEHIVRRVDALLQNKIVDCHFEFLDKHLPKVVVAVSRHLRQLSDVDILPVIRGNVAPDIVEIMIDGDFLADFAAIDEFDGNDRAEQIDQLIGKGRPVLGFVINLFEILLYAVIRLVDSPSEAAMSPYNSNPIYRTSVPFLPCSMCFTSGAQTIKVSFLK